MTSLYRSLNLVPHLCVLLGEVEETRTESDPGQSSQRLHSHSGLSTSREVSGGRGFGSCEGSIGCRGGEVRSCSACGCILHSLGDGACDARGTGRELCYGSQRNFLREGVGAVRVGDTAGARIGVGD